MDKVTDDWTIGQVFVNSKVFFFPKQGENYLQLKTSLTLNQAFVTCLCQQLLLVFSIDLDLKTIKKSHNGRLQI